MNDKQKLIRDYIFLVLFAILAIVAMSSITLSVMTFNMKAAITHLVVFVISGTLMICLVELYIRIRNKEKACNDYTPYGSKKTKS